MVGGQDELVFDGGSLVVDRHGAVAFRAPLFEEDLYVVELVREAASSCRARRRGAHAAARGARLSRARARDARLRRQERLPRRRARAFGRRRLGAHARDRRRCARRRARARGHDAVAVHVEDEPRGRGRASEAARRALRHAVDRADLRDHARGARATCLPACRADATEENIQARAAASC